MDPDYLDDIRPVFTGEPMFIHPGDTTSDHSILVAVYSGRMHPEQPTKFEVILIELSRSMFLFGPCYELAYTYQKLKDDVIPVAAMLSKMDWNSVGEFKTLEIL